MEEQEKLKKQFVIHVIYNMVAFATIFIIFGIFVFFMVRNMTFSFSDKQLFEAKNDLLEINDNFSVLYNILGIKNNSLFENASEYQISKKLTNPQLVLILRDENGNIINENDIGRIKEYASDISFNSSNMNSIYKLKLANKYNYRCLNFEITSYEGSEKQYVQLLINVDSEVILVNRYFEIISYAVIMGIVLSCVASYILSKKTLKPVENILKKQTEFVQNASHELRTPLTIIQAKQELLLQEPNAKIIDKSEEISLTLDEAKRLSKLTKDLMTLVKGSDFKESDLEKEDVNLDDFINKLVGPYADIAKVQEKDFVLNLNCDKDIAISTNKIHQLMVILLDNAIKYTEAGDTIQINTYYKDNKCIIDVCDTGIGISDEGLNRVFDRFYRENQDRNRETGGSGLGLSIASMIVSSHNGTIKALHNKPKGTIFSIKLPR